MKLHYKGKYDMDPEKLPRLPHKPGAVKFKEAEDSKALALVANGVALGVLAVFGIPMFLRCGSQMLSDLFLGALLSLLALFPHELLHGICFKEDVYLYTNWKQGMLFVVGPEDMSKTRFILMSLLPNLVFGAVPYLLGMVFPQLTVLGCFGLISLTSGGGDYYNVYNALTQMPKGARTYLHGFHSWWYIPQ